MKDSLLNTVFTRFEEAATLHNALHAIELRRKDCMPPNLTPQQEQIQDLALDLAIKRIVKQRDEAVELGIKEYQIWKEQNGKSESMVGNSK